MRFDQLEAVFVDWNGTLLDDLRVAYGSVQHFFSDYDLLCPTLDQYREYISTDFMQFYTAFGIPQEHCSLLQSSRRNYIYDHWSDVSLHEGVVDFLCLCHRSSIPVFLVSGESAAILYERHKQFAIASFFTEVIGLRRFKTDSFIRIVREHGLSPDRCVFIDDSRLGLHEAASVGIVSIAFLKGYGHPFDILHLGAFGVQTFRPLSRLFFGDERSSLL